MLLTLQAIYVTRPLLLESTVQLSNRCCMCFDGGLQKLTEHGRQGMQPLAACNGVTEIGDCGYDRVARLTSPFFHACLAYISLLLSAAAV
jgi:hypothetical protein